MLMIERTGYRLLDGNTAAAQRLGFTLENLLDLRLPDLFYPQDWEQARETLHTPLLHQHPTMLRWHMREQAGNTMDVEIEFEELVYSGVDACLLQFQNVINPVQAQQHVDAKAGQTDHGMLENLSDGFFHLDKAGRFTYLNHHALNLFRSPTGGLEGHLAWESYPLVTGMEHRRQYESAMASLQSCSYEMYYEPWQRWHEFRLYPSAQGMSVWFADVTQRRGDWQLRQQEHALLGAIVNGTQEAVISVDSVGLILTFNPGAERIFGFPSADMLGRNVDLLLPERYRSAHAQHRSMYLEAKPNSTRMMGLRMFKGLRSDGQEIDLEGSIANLSVDERRLQVVTLRDVSQRLLDEAERQNVRNQLSRLTHRLMSQEKVLVKRIGQALHDQLGQTMAAIRLVHESIVALRREGAASRLQQLDERLAGLIEQAISQVRVALLELHPPMLDEHGLAAALDNELRKRARTLTGMQLVLVAPPDLAQMRWLPAAEYAAFMIAREAVENAARHSQATRLVLNLSGDSTQFTLEIQDNGRGIKASPDARLGHLGWAGIRERANAIGASVTIGPGARGGTCVHFHWQEHS